MKLITLNTEQRQDGNYYQVVFRRDVPRYVQVDPEAYEAITAITDWLNKHDLDEYEWMNDELAIEFKLTFSEYI